ncbi:MAG: NADP-dependent malic enzyme [Candidatus Portnoybacteria bacterium]|nr:NADP-dependent malic enzyme [Candidatus Portnoybacteria bacterium]
MDYNKQSLSLHKKLKGKLEVCSKTPLETKDDLSIAYTPGVAEVCKLIAKNKKNVFSYTMKANTVAVVTDGSAVLGLGNIGPEAALPVMEGKAVLFKEFGGVDAVPICLNTQETDKIVEAVKLIAPVFGGINLEDISAPRCFEVEERLKKELDIPVFHDDQHGTAIVTLAALLNALKVVRKSIADIKVVINGAGSAALAIAAILLRAGVLGKNMFVIDSKGMLCEGREGMNIYKQRIAKQTNLKKICGRIEDAIAGADVFIGVSVADVLRPEWIEMMAENPIVFAMANPNPEISFEAAKKTKIAIFGTGRSDYPNQINNVLAFPGIFRGVFDIKARAITEEMKLAAAKAIANLVSKKELSKDFIIPSPFDKRVCPAVAGAVKKAYRK